MWKASPGLCRYVALNGSYMDALAGLVLRIYAGAEPASSADSTEDNTLLCEINPNGEGLQFEEGGTLGSIVKDTNQIWTANESAAGTATFFRIEESGDDGSANVEAIRLQGSVGTVSGDMILSNTTFAVGAPRTIKNFTLVIPSI